MTGATWFHSLLGGHDFTHTLYIHYIIGQSKNYVYGLMTGLFAWISLTALSWNWESWTHALWVMRVRLGDQTNKDTMYIKHTLCVHR